MTVGGQVMATLRKADTVARSRQAQASLTFHSEVEAGWLLHDKHHEHFNFFHALFHHDRVETEGALVGPGRRTRRISEGPIDVPGDLFDVQLAWRAARPHLSRHVMHEAEETFLQYSDATKEVEIVLALEGLGQTRDARSGGVSGEGGKQHKRRVFGPSEDNTSRIATDMSTNIKRLLQTAEMPYRMLPRAMKDMGLFPTQLELQRYHHDLSQRRRADGYARDEAAAAPTGRRGGENQIDTEFVDYAEFVEIVKILMLDDLNATERENLHDLYVEFADSDGRLHPGGFGQLMDR